MSVTVGVNEASIRAIIADVVGRETADALAVDQPFDEAGLDSLEHGQILIGLEETHGVRVADEDFERCNSVGAILDYAGR